MRPRCPQPSTPGERALGRSQATTGRSSSASGPRTPGASTSACAARTTSCADEGHGIRGARVEAAAGDDYVFVLDGRELPDPASRWQPEGLRGPSRVVDPRSFAWTDGGWHGGAELQDAVIYELHVGTFTEEGTFEAAIDHLPGLAALGITHVELMPVAEFPGAHGWGYDGVYLSAAQSSYGGPHGLQRLVDAAHAAGLGVILDVVYNHLGASGIAAMEAFGPYFTEKYEIFWGKAINFDDADSDPVREWVLQSAEGWIRDFHVDGLRLDAIHAIFDMSAKHILRELNDRVHTRNHRALVIAESGLNDPKVTRPRSAGGWGCDAEWADDFHHALRVLLTGDTDGLLRGVRPRRAAREGLPAPVCPRRRLLDVPPPPLRRPGRRTAASSSSSSSTRTTTRSATAPSATACPPRSSRSPPSARCCRRTCRCCSWARSTARPRRSSSSPTTSTRRSPSRPREGRRREFSAFAAFSAEDVPDPQDEETFLRSKLTREGDEAIRALYVRLLDVRRELPAGRRRRRRLRPAVPLAARAPRAVHARRELRRDARIRPGRGRRRARPRHRTTARAWPTAASTCPPRGSAGR